MKAAAAAPLLTALALALVSCAGEPVKGSGEHEATQPSGPCEKIAFEDVPLTVCTADPAHDRILTAIGPEKGPPFRSLSAYAASRAADAPPVAFAMNAGMFDDNGRPIGYFVENGERLHGLNRAKGPGNFHMQPNGVFFGTDGKWEVRTTEDFFENVDSRPAFGTQSGPMLLVNGQLPTDIDPDGVSLRIRNAVGTNTAGHAFFVISDEPISFGKLARFYRDVLKAQNVLFLDGTVSSLWSPRSGRLDTGYPIGPLIVVEKRAKAPVEKDAP